MTEHTLAETAKRLTRAAPAEWTEFVAAFRKHADEALNNVMRADINTVVVMQGHARETRALLRVFETAMT